MKRFQTEYSENSITYWPAYEAGKIGIIFLTTIGTLFVATAIWTLLDNPSRGTKLITQVALPIVVLILYIVLRYFYRTMHQKIVVTNTGITYHASNIAAEKQIWWKDVDAVYFTQDLWYGRKSCRIFCCKAQSQKINKEDSCDFVLPVYAVDEQKFLQLIPNHLWKNKPWN